MISDRKGLFRESISLGGLAARFDQGGILINVGSLMERMEDISTVCAPSS